MSFYALFIVIKSPQIEKLKGGISRIGYDQNGPAKSIDFYDALETSDVFAGVYKDNIIILGSNFIGNIINDEKLSIEESALIEAFPSSDILVVDYGEGVGSGAFLLIENGKRIRFLNSLEIDVGERIPIERSILKKSNLSEINDTGIDDEIFLHGFNNTLGFKVAEELGIQYLGFDFTAMIPLDIDFIEFERKRMPIPKSTNEAYGVESSEEENDGIVLMGCPLEEENTLFFGVKINWILKKELVFEYAVKIVNQVIATNEIEITNAKGRLKLLFKETIDIEQKAAILSYFQEENDLKISFGLYDDYRITKPPFRFVRKTKS